MYMYFISCTSILSQIRNNIVVLFLAPTASACRTRRCHGVGSSYAQWGQSGVPLGAEQCGLPPSHLHRPLGGGARGPVETLQGR